MDTQTPQPTLTLWQRLMADAPTFWKKLQLYGLLLGGATAAVATNIPQVPKTWLAVAAGISAAMVGLSQLAVKDSTVLENPNATLQDVVNAIPALKQQITDLHSAVVTTVQAVQDKGAAGLPADQIPVVTDQAPPVTGETALPVADAITEAPTDPVFEAAVQAEVTRRLGNSI